MGCGTSKEKLEDELLKAKLERTEIQYERQKQIKLLKELDGTEYKSKILPEEEPNANAEENISKKPQIKSKSLKIRPKRSQSFASKKKTFMNRENTNSEAVVKRKKSFRKKSMNIN